MPFENSPTIKQYVIVDSHIKLYHLAQRLMAINEFAFDTETNTLRVYGKNKKFRLVGMSISWGDNDNYYIPTNHRRIEDIDRNVPVDMVRDFLKIPFERENIRLIGHGLKFDLHVLKRIGIEPKTTDFFDTMLASWLCNENTPNGLKENSMEKLNLPQTHFAEVTNTVPKEVKLEFGLKANNKATFDLVLIDDGALYALADSFNTWKLYLGFLDLLVEEKMDKIYYNVYIPFMLTLFHMEERGAVVDVNALYKMRDSMLKDIEELEYKIFECAGVEFNASSNQQLAEILFGYRKPDTKDKKGNTKKAKVNENLLKVSFNFRVISKTKTGAPQCNNDVIWKLSKMSFKNSRKQEGVKMCNYLLEYKKLQKLESAFVEGLLEQMYDDGKVHPSFNQIGTDSGRLSCSNPNLQQLPKADERDPYQIRSLFIGSIDPETKKRKKIIAIDFANLEMRVLAHFSKDKNLLNMFLNDEDTHGSTAVNMFNLDCTAEEVKKKYPHLRQAAKVINFLLMYGGSAPTLYDSLKSDHYNPVDLGAKEYLDLYKAKDGIEVAQIYIDRYFTSYKGVSEFIKNQKRFAKKHGYVYSLLRRKRRLPDINSYDYKTASYCERLAVNSAIQGSAADLTSSAQVRIFNDPWFKEHNVHMIIQVHDEIVLESPEEYVEETIKKVQQYMEHPFGDDIELNLPLRADADFGDSYQDAK